MNKDYSVLQIKISLLSLGYALCWSNLPQLICAPSVNL